MWNCAACFKANENKNSNESQLELTIDLNSRDYFLIGKYLKFAFRSLGTLTVEEVYKDRDQFAALVREVAAPDVGRMGIEILSFTIKDVYDDVQYLQSLGKAQTASVKRDADSGVAEANRWVKQASKSMTFD